jgi:hypothetical protein
MAGDLHMSDIGGMILRPNIVVLHYPRCVEIGDERCTGLVGLICGIAHRVVEDVVREVVVGVEVLIDGIYLRKESSGLFVRVTNSTEAFPQRLLLDKEQLQKQGNENLL